MRRQIARGVVAVALLAAVLGGMGMARAEQIVVCQTAGVAVACVAGPEHGIVVVVATQNGNAYGVVWYCDATGDHLAYQFGRSATAGEAPTRDLPGRCAVGG